MIDQRKAEMSAVAGAVCASLALEEEGPDAAFAWYKIAERYCVAKTPSEKRAFGALFASAMGKYSKPSGNVAKTPAIDS
jgi:hypothetical protein